MLGKTEECSIVLRLNSKKNMKAKVLVKILPVRSEIQTCLHAPFLFNIILVVFFIAIEQERDNRGI